MYEVLAGIPTNGNSISLPKFSISLPKFSRSMNLCVWNGRPHETEVRLLGYQTLGESAFKAGVSLTEGPSNVF